MAGEQRLRRSLREVADVRAVLGRVVRDDGVGEDLRAVVERVGEDVIELLLGARLDVAEDDGGAVLPPRAACGRAAWATTTSIRRAGARTIRGVDPSSVRGVGRVDDPLPVVFREAEGADAGNVRGLAVGEVDDDEGLGADGVGGGRGPA